jgi:hypothetical protein
VADVQIAVGFGREAGADGLVLPAGEVIAHDLADEILLAGRRGIGGMWRSVAVESVDGAAEAWFMERGSGERPLV